MRELITKAASKGFTDLASNFIHTSMHRAWGYVWPKFVVQLEVSSSEDAYEWLRLWLSEHPYGAAARNLTLTSTNRSLLDEDDERARPQFSLGPGPHFLQFEGHHILINIEAQAAVKGLRSASVAKETMHLTLFGTDRSVLERLVQLAWARFHKLTEDRIEVYGVRYGEWSVRNRPTPRSFESLVYADQISERIHADLERFISRREWYETHGVPWRRGYLLYGEPGNGKSSLVMALAGRLKMGIAVLNLAAAGIDDEQLGNLCSRAPAKTVLLLEDIDSIFVQREAQTESRITFTGLLNVLDGVVSTEGRILFMTTNRKDALDPALVRAGRADVHQYIGNATALQAAAMFRRFFPSDPEASATQFGAAHEGKSMAEVQEILIRRLEEREGVL